MLYAIEGTDTLLMGTMHIVPRGQDKWQADARRAFDWAEHLVFEMRFDEPSHLGAISTRHGPVPGEMIDLLESLWPTERLGALRDYNVPVAWTVGCGLGMDISLGVEGLVKEWAGGQEGSGQLESPEEFADAFALVPTMDFISSLRFKFKEQALMKKRLEQMYRAWRGHDVAKIARLRSVDLPQSISRAMFDDRNDRWAPRVAELARSPRKTLIFVGAGHLCGDHSLLEVLQRQHGLTSKRTSL